MSLLRATKLVSGAGRTNITGRFGLPCGREEGGRGVRVSCKQEAATASDSLHKDTRTLDEEGGRGLRAPRRELDATSSGRPLPLLDEEGGRSVLASRSLQVANASEEVHVAEFNGPCSLSEEG